MVPSCRRNKKYHGKRRFKARRLGNNKDRSKVRSDSQFMDLKIGRSKKMLSKVGVAIRWRCESPVTVGFAVMKGEDGG